MKKFFAVFLAVVVLAFVSALPAVASPPGAAPVLEAFGFDLGAASNYIVQEQAPAAAVTPVGLESAASTFDSVPAAGLSILYIAIASAATLAYLMSGTASVYAQGKYVGRSRGFANGNCGGRRWV